MAVRDITYAGEGLIPMPLNGPALRYTTLPKSVVTDIALHHWTGWLPPETWTANEEIAYIRRIDEYHRTGRGLDGIGYHLAPFPSGRVYIVSRLDYYGAHVGYENNHLIGVGLPGSFRSHVPSPRHLAATVEAVQFVYDYLGRDVPTTPHFYWGGTTCPGERWPEWVPQLWAAALQEDDMTPEEVRDIVRAMTFEPTENNRPVAAGRRLDQWLGILRQNINDHKEEPHAGGYTDAKAVKAVKDKL